MATLNKKALHIGIKRLWMSAIYLDECCIFWRWVLHIWTSATYPDDGGYISGRLSVRWRLHIWTGVTYFSVTARVRKNWYNPNKTLYTIIVCIIYIYIYMMYCVVGLLLSMWLINAPISIPSALDYTSHLIWDRWNKANKFDPGNLIHRVLIKRDHFLIPAWHGKAFRVMLPLERSTGHRTMVSSVELWPVLLWCHPWEVGQQRDEVLVIWGATTHPWHYCM